MPLWAQLASVAGLVLAIVLQLLAIGRWTGGTNTIVAALRLEIREVKTRLDTVEHEAPKDATFRENTERRLVVAEAQLAVFGQVNASLIDLRARIDERDKYQGKQIDSTVREVAQIQRTLSTLSPHIMRISGNLEPVG